MLADGNTKIVQESSLYCRPWPVSEASRGSIWMPDANDRKGNTKPRAILCFYANIGSTRMLVDSFAFLQFQYESPMKMESICQRHQQEIEARFHRKPRAAKHSVWMAFSTIWLVFCWRIFSFVITVLSWFVFIFCFSIILIFCASILWTNTIILIVEIQSLGDK